MSFALLFRKHANSCQFVYTSSSFRAKNKLAVSKATRWVVTRILRHQLRSGALSANDRTRGRPLIVFAAHGGVSEAKVTLVRLLLVGWFSSTRSAKLALWRAIVLFLMLISNMAKK